MGKTGRKYKKINSEEKKALNALRAERLKECMELYNIKGADIERSGACHASEVSIFIKGTRNLTDAKISDIQRECFPDVKIEYLLGYSDYKNDEELKVALLAKRDEVSRISMEANQAAQILLEHALNGVYMEEELTKLKAQGLSEHEALKKLTKVKLPENLISTTDAYFLSLQLQEEAEKLIWSYLHRKNSPLWNFVSK